MNVKINEQVCLQRILLVEGEVDLLFRGSALTLQVEFNLVGSSSVLFHIQVDFMVRLTSNHCLNGNKEFSLKVQGISETVKVSVETLCDCDCRDKEIDSKHCHYNGTLSCGACRQVPYRRHNALQMQKCYVKQRKKQSL